MIKWLIQRCFTNLEQEKQKSNLLLLIMIISLPLAECNVLQNNPFWSKQNIFFLISFMVIIIVGIWLIRYKAFISKYKFLIMSFWMIVSIEQVYLFNRFPEVYQVFYFNLAMSLIYLDGRLILLVGGVSALFTIVGRTLFSQVFFPLLDKETINIPVGLMIETTLVLFGVTRIGRSFTVILDKKNEISKLLRQNETQLNIIANQKKALEEYSSQVEVLTLKEETNRIAKELQNCLGRNLNATVFELEMIKSILNDTRDAETKLTQIIDNINSTIKSYKSVFNPLFLEEDTNDILADINGILEVFLENTKVNVNLDISGDYRDLFQPYEHIILRTIQEVLITALYSSNTTQIDILLEFTQEKVNLKISDNGIIDNPDTLDETEAIHFRLTNIVEKIRSFQGKIEILIFKEKGKAISIILPQHKLHDHMINVVIIDTDKFVRDSLELILSEEKDISVLYSLENGKQLIQKKIVEQIPDVIILEIDLGELNGIESLKHYKEKWPNVKVIILTNSKDIGHVVDAINAGADAYLLKSTSSKNLAMSIRYLIDGGNLLSKEAINMLANQVTKNQNLKLLEKKLSKQEIIKKYSLKEKELQILSLLAKGLKYKEIATSLYITDGTVRNYISSVYSKLNVEEKSQALQKATELGLIS